MSTSRSAWWKPSSVTDITLNRESLHQSEANRYSAPFGHRDPGMFFEFFNRFPDSRESCDKQSCEKELKRETFIDNFFRTTVTNLE
jgi:hypothetical protein